ncbi:hypothetical protein KIF59_21845 [Enterobacter cloacae subsp. cloacae]|nr:hypothetical protein [Enterobacter cloacae subsp. cloacae]
MCGSPIAPVARSLQRRPAQSGECPDARQLASQKPTDPGSGVCQRLYLSGNDRDRAALAHLETLPRILLAIFRSLPTACKVIRCSETTIACATAARAGGGKSSSSATCFYPYRFNRRTGAAAGRSQCSKNGIQRRVAARATKRSDAILGPTEIYSAGRVLRAELAKPPRRRPPAVVNSTYQRRIAMLQAGR